ncbi:MAG TPA: HAMP domain-containing sensor histidine kinase [Cytophagaceae bacterium]|jgi:signal transduction histidine kinase|nr:HAMP domain-containing sensor histidine kinase [Cytophagaceae bacterium]
MGAHYKYLSSKLFAPVDRKIWTRTLNLVDCRRDCIIFRIFVYVTIVLIFSNSLQYYLGIYRNYWIVASQLSVFIFSAFLLYKGKDLWAKNLVLIFMNCTFFYNSSTFGRDVPSYLYVFPIVLSTLFFFNSDQVKYSMSLLLLIFVNLLLLEYTDYSFFRNDVVLTPSQLKVRTIINLVISLSLGAILMKELIFMHRYNQRRLKRLNLKLKRKNEKLNKINRELDSFVYRSSHDLRSPLTSIMGIINIIKSETNVEKIQEYMMFQERSVKKLDTLIQDILNISRNARLEIVVEAIPIKQFILHCLEGLSDMEEYGKVSINVDVPESLVVYSDVNRLRVIFHNLFSNALRYYDHTKERPFLTVQLVSPDADRAELLITDNGIGIKYEHLDKVFDMFYRATDQNNGSGLGLYIVKEAIHKIEGKIELKSVYGEGTSVLITIVNLGTMEGSSNSLHGTLFTNRS